MESVARINAPTRTVAIHIPGTDTLLAEGMLVHNDMPATAHSGSGSGSGSGAGPGSGSGSGIRVRLQKRIVQRQRVVGQ